MATHFSLPGLMALLVLVNPDSGGLWRVSLGVAAGGGIVALIALRAPAPGKLGLAGYIAAIAAYVVIVILAIHPHIVGQLSFPIAPERIAAVLLAGLVFAGVNVAWLLMFENAEPAPSPTASRRRAGWLTARCRRVMTSRQRDSACVAGQLPARASSAALRPVAGHREQPRRQAGVGGSRYGRKDGEVQACR